MCAADLLRAGERVLLDDVTVEDIQAALGVPVAISPCAGDGLLRRSWEKRNNFIIYTFIKIQSEDN